MDLDKCREIADENLEAGLKIGHSDVITARWCLSLAYGYYKRLDDAEKAGLCLEKLRETGLSEMEIRRLQREGLEDSKFDSLLYDAFSPSFRG